jgi:hypothetical protein
MMISDEDRGKSRRLDVEEAQVRYSVAGWSGGWSYKWKRREAQVSWFSLKTDDNGLSVVWPQNHYNGVWQNHLGEGVHWPESAWAILDKVRTQTTHISTIPVYKFK